MTYTVDHRYVDQDLTPSITKQHGIATVHCSASGSLPIRFPGKIVVSAQSSYYYHLHTEDTGGGPGGGPGGHGPPLHGGWSVSKVPLPLTIQIKTPDGRLFAADHVTRADLDRFRDLRGTSQGEWTFSVSGQSAPIEVQPGDSEVSAADGYLVIAIEETVTSKSAPPLVNDSLAPQAHRIYHFDLFRVGTFVASTGNDGFLGNLSSRMMKLTDPDGVEVAASAHGQLSFPVTLATLDKSRDAQGNVRNWSLEVWPALPPLGGSTVWASVIATSVIHTQTIKSRIDDLIGVGGSKLSIYGEMRQDGMLLARIQFLDKFTAETFDLLNLLDGVFKRYPQDPGADISNLQPNVAYTLAQRSRDIGDWHISLDGVKVDRINIDVGASEHIQPSVPALKIELLVEGTAIVKYGGFPLVTVGVNDNRIALEAGVQRNADGTFSAQTWINDDPLSIDISWEAAIAAGIVSFGALALLGEGGVKEFVQNNVNDKIVQGFHDVLANVMSQVPRILAIVLGDDFTYRALRLSGNDIVFDYVAPLEPDPKPSPYYIGVIGRGANQLGPNIWQFSPPSLGDTWSVPNLAEKIDHIVMVMMENRAFDHVLGYLATLPGAQGIDGLAPGLTAFLEANNFPVGRLRDSAIVPNALGLKTKFPISVGHHLADVAQQLSAKLTDASGRTINSPQGFVDNFSTHGISPLSPNDVLGYYIGDDLPFTRYLAENYTHCERYFSSHPGPTLPNRMYWLSGDVQYDRTGEAILDNNNGDNFALSRAMTIFDLLTRKGVSWRVYESPPSVAMLRMFARYATDDTNIVSIDRLQQDVDRGNLPAVTAIEPAMHHAPENDDHPIADMYYGQMFLKRVYDTLRSNGALWQRTMLVITYDEHGGFYDHVVPPTADIRQLPMVATDGGSVSAPFTASTLITGYGLRVPLLVVSPWTPAGKGPDLVLDHCSLQKTILARFCGASKPFQSDRVNASRTLDAYVSEPSPRTDVPPSPAIAVLPFVAPAGAHMRIDTETISRKKLMDGTVEFHDLSGAVARLLGR